MTMSVGTVSVTSVDSSGDPVRTGSGAAVALFDAISVAKLAANPLPALPVLGATTFPWSVDHPVSATDVDAAKAGRLVFYKDIAATATGIAAFVTYITSNAVINVAGFVTAHVTSQRLGKTPNPNDPATAIDPPASAVDIPLAGTGHIQ